MEVTKGIHLLEETKGSFVYVVLGDEPVLVDTGMAGKGEQIIAALQRIGIGPTDLAHIVLTHHDVDHIGNARQLQAWSRATVWAPEAEIPYIHGAARERGIRQVLKALMRVDRSVDVRAYEAGGRVGGLEVIPAPGHTPGHVCLRAGDTLLAGDLVTTRRGALRPSPGFLTWDKAALRRSLQEVGRLTFDWVCPAHGLPVRRGNLWETLL
ncbi:MAG: MBL fold metallo-hydrolase [Alicyclobacillus sp.]|nr:MBL fold metallo-hydrolase [Alicyclobacillus sp.]